MLAMDVARGGDHRRWSRSSARSGGSTLCAFLLEVASIVFLPARDCVDPRPRRRGRPARSPTGSCSARRTGRSRSAPRLFAAVAALPFADLFDRPFALVFWIDAATFLVSFVVHRAAHDAALGRPTSSDDADEDVRFRDAFRIPLVRAVMPAAFAGRARTRRAVLARHRVRARGAATRPTPSSACSSRSSASARRWASACSSCAAGATRSTRRASVSPRSGASSRCSASPALVWLAFVGAAAFGAAAAFTLVVGDGRAPVARSRASSACSRSRRSTSCIRIGLGLAAVGAGLAGDLLGDVNWPLVGDARAVAGRAAVLGPAGRAVVRAGPTARASRVGSRSLASHDGARGVTVAIVTDSAAALPPELAASVRHHRRADVAHGRRASPEPEGRRPLERARGAGQRVTTSAPTPGEFEARDQGRVARQRRRRWC